MPWRALLLAFALFPAGCSSDGLSNVTAEAVLPGEYDPVAACVLNAVVGVSDVLERASETFLAIRNPAASTITTPFGSATEWIFDAGNFTGSATFSADPSGGMKAGDSVVLVWNYDEGAISGDGTFTVLLLGDTQASLHGAGELYREVGCAFDIAIDEAEPVAIELTRFSDLAQAGSGPGLAGAIALNVLFGASTFNATLVFDARGITITNATLNGAPLVPVTISWQTLASLIPPAPTLPPPPPPGGGAVTAAWNGSWTMFYRCVLFGNPLFDGTSTMDISHAPGASTFTGTESDGPFVYPLQVVSLSGNTAVVRIEYVYQQDPLDSSKDVDVIEESTWTWFAAGKGHDQAAQPIDIPGAPERFCKISRVILKGSNPPQVLFVCFGTALRDSAAENPLNRICATWVLP